MSSTAKRPDGQTKLMIWRHIRICNRMGFSPTLREIGREVGCTSTATIHDHVEKLIRDGQVDKIGQPGSARNLIARDWRQ